ncbi:MAG TPA: adenylate/guanylate cyclase domain-containing protein [Caldimonas sp.]|jgi:class 3 adenylate cyclase/tetratricopeptide (TPR) repeat protein|nr:adenylate/guanylate cyclase domain-containing protein [Caldimonas sp.]HEX2542640.1 adenylate/guanylate cyclase domain-containing protein [Caldimonas sp.]
MINCPKCNEENPPKFRLCGYCGAPLVAAPPALPVREVRRTVTLIFVDLKGSTALGEKLDPEAMHEVKERYFTAMAAEITKHGGKIEKYIGDAIMAVFGLPLPHEDDALRAVRAANGMQAALRGVNEDLFHRYGVKLANRTGVNTGEVVANDDPTADQKLATGDAVNVTARLEQAAPENEIYLGETTYRLVRDAVEVEAVEPLELKGKTERVAAYRLVSAAGLDGYVRRHDSPIVGRDEELAAIDQALREVGDTRAVRMITIIGDAGIGKSRLAQEVIARAGTNAQVVRGRCLAYGDGITFWPLREMTGEAAEIRFDDKPEDGRAKLATLVGDQEIADRLAAAVGLSSAAFPLHEIYWAARKFLESLTADGPLVALIDDIHWAESAFLDLLVHVLDSSENAPILLLCTSRHDLLEKRPEWGERASSLRLVLRPLTDAAAAKVASNLLGATGLPADVAARIVEAAEGNPLYVEQMLSMLVDSGALREEDGRWIRAESYGEIAIPPTIKALIEGRLGQLRREERAAIEPASVIGMQFAEAAVASLTPQPVRPAVEGHLLALTRKQLVHSVASMDADSLYRFHHHLVRDTVYGGLLKRARATLHVDFVRWADEVNAQRGRALEFEAILGYHLEQAHNYLAELGPLDERGREIGRDAARRLASAGRRAFARGDVNAAASLFGRAVTLLDKDDPLRLPLLPELGEVQLELGKFADARAVVDEALNAAKAAENRRVEAAAKLLRMQVRLHSGESGSWSDATLELTTETIPLLERDEAHAELAKAWRLVALVQQIAGQLGKAGETISKVVTHARLAGDERLVARSALGLTLSAVYGPTPVTDAIAQCEALIAGDLPDRQVQNLIICKIAQLHAMNGDNETARRNAQSARAVLRDLGQGVRAASASLDLAIVELIAGDPAAAEREVRPDCEMLQGMGETYFLSTMAAMLARAVRDQGRDDEALELTKTAESTAADDDVDAQVDWRSVRAPILARNGALSEAEALARQAVELAMQTEAPTLRATALWDLATVLSLAQRADEARLALSDAIELYAAKGDRQSLERAKVVLADISKEQGPPGVGGTPASGSGRRASDSRDDVP